MFCNNGLLLFVTAGTQWVTYIDPITYVNIFIICWLFQLFIYNYKTLFLLLRSFCIFSLMVCFCSYAFRAIIPIHFFCDKAVQVCPIIMKTTVSGLVPVDKYQYVAKAYCNCKLFDGILFFIFNFFQVCINNLRCQQWWPMDESRLSEPICYRDPNSGFYCDEIQAIHCSLNQDNTGTGRPSIRLRAWSSFHVSKHGIMCLFLYIRWSLF